MISDRIKLVLHKSADEPFRLFFLLGAICAFLGVFYWPLKLSGLAFQTTSSLFHTHLQIYGFLFAFVIGFITTALPRLTRAGSLTVKEFSLLVIFYLAMVVELLLEQYASAQALFLITLAAMIFVLGKRFRRRKRNPPETFIFIPFAFFSAALGTLFLIGFRSPDLNLPLAVYDLGTALVFQSWILFLLLGVGGFLIRSILGWAEPLPAGQGETLVLPATQRKKLWIHFACAVLLLASFFIEVLESRFLGLTLRAVIVAVECFGQIKIHRKVVSGKLTSLALQFSLWTLVIGTWAIALLPEQYTIGLEHFVFVGGFAMSTFAVATRVILSHCGHSQMLNRSYKPFSVAMVLMTVAMLARVAADFFGFTYEHHLAYSGLAWVAGLLIWCWTILRLALQNTFAKPVI